MTLVLLPVGQSHHRTSDGRAGMIECTYTLRQTYRGKFAFVRFLMISLI
jgi:hypothetical protein